MQRPAAVELAKEVRVNILKVVSMPNKPLEAECSTKVYATGGVAEKCLRGNHSKCTTGMKRKKHVQKLKP